MADYKEIKGLYIQTVSSDPSNITAGDVWYNSTLGKLRGAKQVGAWASGGNMNTARGFHGMAGQGTQTAAMGFGGTVSPKQQTEKYDGSSWTEVGDLNTGRSAGGGCGSQTAALYGGGYVAPATDASPVPPAIVSVFPFVIDCVEPDSPAAEKEDIPEPVARTSVVPK